MNSVTKLASENRIQIERMHLFALMRYLHLQYQLPSTIGYEKSIQSTPLRFGQMVKLSSQERQINHIEHHEDRARVKLQGFGMLGSNGILPIHISEAIYEKILHDKNTAFIDFLDIFHHRLVGLFYKAWLTSEPAVMLESPDGQRFNEVLSAFAGIGALECSELEQEFQYNQYYYTCLLLNQNMPVENLQEILSCYFNFPIRIQQNLGQWKQASEFATTLSSNASYKLGEGILIGTQYFDKTQKFRVIIGPVDVRTYQRLLPNGDLAKLLHRWIVRYTKLHYQFDIEVIVDKNDIAESIMNATHALGHTSWLGRPATNPSVIIQYS